MHRTIITLAVLASVLPTLGLNAQSGSMRVIMPSPTAATLGKFGDVPVSLYTGIPDISIPLFTAKGRTLELPIVLRYHAGGIRVEEIGGWAGIGWTLEAGGTITRTVRGIVDDRPNGYYTTGYTFYEQGHWPDPPSTILDHIRDEFLDGEPDQFFFDFAGRSGQFVLGPTSTSTTLKEARTIPNQKIRIEPNLVSGSFASFLITTEDGTRYTFGAADTSTDFTFNSPHFSESHTSSWQLTGIHAVGGDSITLYYRPYTARHKVGRYEESTHDVVASQSPCGPGFVDFTNDEEIRIQRLDSIKSAAHTVHFIASTLRTDALSPTGTPQEWRLDTITVTTPAGIMLRRFMFEYDYSTGRLTLKRIYEQDRNRVSLPPYSFTYNATTLPAYSSASQDHWGYYNGKQNANLLPRIFDSHGNIIPGADRSPDLAFMRAGILTNITYPTGGSSAFVYEANAYWGVGESPKSTDLYSAPFSASQSKSFTVGGVTLIDATIYMSYPNGGAGCDQFVCAYVQIPGVGTWWTPGTYNISLSPGTYSLNTGATSDEDVYGRVEWRETSDMNVTAGGLRVAEIRTVDAMAGPTSTKITKYKYTFPDGRTSAVINGIPAYGVQYSSNVCSFFSRSTMPRPSLGAGPTVGYADVEVWHGANGEYGKSRHRFITGLDPLPSGWPFSRRTNYEWNRGQEIGAT
jgi:hypothetical protein